jgi:signal transduction histidine kinase
MSLTTGRGAMRSAAWSISLWATLAFACGTMIVFVFLQQFMARDIQRRTDAWLAGEVEVLGDVAERTPKDALYGRVVGEVAELASKEVPNKQARSSGTNNSVFFLQTSAQGALSLWVGAGNGERNLEAIRAIHMQTDRPTDLRVPGFSIPFRVASIPIADGSRIYLGVSERDELRVLHKLTLRFVVLSLSLILLAFFIVFFTTRRMLSHVRGITEAASRIGHADLTTRVPTTDQNDEIAQLALTLNHMLDRIESTVRQLHTMTDALAHDLRSPLTAIRGKLELSLPGLEESHAEPIVGAIEELDRLADFLNQSLDVAEAQADALRLTLTTVDLSELVTKMADLYEPSMSEKGLHLALHCDRSVKVTADAALLHRMVANLLDNALKHLPAGCSVWVESGAERGIALLRVSDSGPGFETGVLAQLFQTRVRGRNSSGHGLGLAFVHAVARAHGGGVTARNSEGGGAAITVSLPLAAETEETACLPAVSRVS